MFQSMTGSTAIEWYGWFIHYPPPTDVHGISIFKVPSESPVTLTPAAGHLVKKQALPLLTLWV